AYGAGEHGTRTGEELRPTATRLQRAQYESGESRRAQSGTASGTGAVAGVHRIGERADLRVQRTDRSSGPAELSAGGAAEAGEGRGNVNRADVFADAGRPASLPQEPRCGLLSGAAAGTKKLWSERAANAHQQGRRPVSADVVGARSAAHSGSVRSGLRSQALGSEVGRARREKREEASHRGHGQKAGGVAASPVGKRRSVRAIAQQPPNHSCGSCVKTKSFQEEKDKSQSRVP